MSILRYGKKIAAQGGVLMGGGGKGGGGGGGQQQVQQQQNAYSNISPWAQPYVSSILGAGQAQIFDTATDPGSEGYYVDQNGARVSNDVALGWKPTNNGFNAWGEWSGEETNPFTYVAGTPSSTTITGMKPYNAYGSYNPETGGQFGMTPSDMMAANAAVAGFTPLQQQAYQGAANLQMPGQFGAATDFAGTAGYGALGTTGAAGQYGAMGANYGSVGAMQAQRGAQQAQRQAGFYGLQGDIAGQQAAGYGALGAQTGQNVANMSTDPGAIGAYMNPYLQNALAPSQNLLNQQYGMQSAAEQGAATQKGAFGGSRNALMQGLSQQNRMLAQNQLVSNAYQQAYNQGIGQMNQAAALGMQGTAQGISGQQAAMQGAGVGLSGVGQQLSAGQLGLSGTAQGMQGAGMGLQGVGAQQAGYGLAGSQGVNLANIGTGQLAANTSILGTQNAYGGQQQQQAQNIINAGMTNYQTGQNWGINQLQQLSNLASPYITRDTTTTQQAAQPSTMSQLAGLGTAGVAGLALASKAKGGVIKGYAAGGAVKFDGGGIAAINRQALLDPTSMSQKTLQNSTKNGVIAPPVSGIAKAIQLSEQVNGKSAAALEQPTPQGTIMDELEAKASQMDQAEAMKEMLPKAMAVLKQKLDQALEQGDVESAQKYAAELQQLVQMAQQQQAPETPSAPAPEGIEQIAPQPMQTAQAPQQGIDSAPSNLPEQTMAEGGIATFSSKGYVDEDEYQTAEEAEDAELEQLFGTGSENDFVQAVAARGKAADMHPSAGIKISGEPIKATGKGHKYHDAVIEEAKRKGLPVEMALHALYKETGGLKDPENARSKAGAIGIMQLMPKTAKGLGVDPMDPVQNIQGGVSYLKQMYDKYQDPRLALMAYNAGPGRVDKALRSEQGLASLPSETRNYAAGGTVRGYYDGDLVEAVPEAISGNSLLKDYLLSDAEKTAEYKAEIARENKRLLDKSPAPSNVEIAKRELGIEGTGIPSMLRRGDRSLTSSLAQYQPSINEPAKESPSELRKLYESVKGSIMPSASAAPVVSQGDVANRDSYRNAPAVAAAPAAPKPQPDPLGRYPVTPIGNNGSALPKDGQNPQLEAIKQAKQQFSSPSSQPDIYQEILGDIKAGREEAKKNRETNNLLALMQAGFGAAASKNINPLGAIAEGGSAGVGALAQFRKQEADEAKDLRSQQLGLYKYKTAQETAEKNAAALERYREATLGGKTDPEDLKINRFNTALSRNPQIAELNRMLSQEQKDGTLTPERYTQYQTNIQKVTKALAGQYGVTPDVAVQLAPITDPAKVKKPGFFENLFGSSKPESGAVDTNNALLK